MQRFDERRDHHRENQHRDRKRESGIKGLHGGELWLRPAAWQGVLPGWRLDTRTG